MAKLRKLKTVTAAAAHARRDGSAHTRIRLVVAFRKWLLECENAQTAAIVGSGAQSADTCAASAFNSH